MTDIQTSSTSSQRIIYFWQDTQITKQQYDRLWRIGLRPELRKEIAGKD